MEVQQCLIAGDHLAGESTHTEILDWQRSGLRKCWLELDEVHTGSRLSFFYSTEDWSKLEFLTERATTFPSWVRGIGLDYIGLMSRRPGSPTKMILKYQKHELGSTLRKLNWSGDILFVEEVQRTLFPASDFRLSVDLVGSNIGDVLGIELPHDPTLLEALEVKGLLTSAEANVVKSWEALVTPSGWEWPAPACPSKVGDLVELPVFRRSVSHYKIVFRSGGKLTLKVYLFFSLGHLTSEDLQAENLLAMGSRPTDVGNVDQGELPKIEQYLNGKISSEALGPVLRRRAFEVAWWMSFVRKL